MKRCCVIVLAVALTATFFLYGQPLAGDTGCAFPANARPEPMQAGPPQDADSEEIEGIRKKIKEIEDSTEIEAALKESVLEEYRSALSRLERAKKSRNESAQYESAIQTAPEEIKKQQEQLARLDSRPPRDPAAEFPTATAKELSAQISKEKSDLASKEGQLDNLEDLVKKLKSRPGKAREELDEAERKLAETKKELEMQPPPEQPPLLTEAWRTKLEGQRTAGAANIQKLEQEILSIDIRSELAALQRDLMAREVEYVASFLKRLETFTAERKQQEAEKAREEAERALRDAAGKHPVVVALVREYADLSQQMEELVALSKSAKEDKDACEEKLNRIRNDFEDASEKLEIAGLSEIVGKLLLNQRDKLPDIVYFRSSAEDRKKQITAGRLKQHRVVEQLDTLGELRDDEAVEQVISEGVDADLTDETGAEIRDELLEYIRKKRDLLGQLAASYEDYLAVLVDTDVTQNRLEQKAGEFAAFLDEHLLWIPSLMPVSIKTVEGIPSSIAWFCDPAVWIDVGRCFIVQIKDRIITASSLVLLVIALFLLSFRLKKALHSAAAKVGNVRTDSFFLTVQSMAITLLLAARCPILLFCLSWILSSPGDSTVFTRACASSLQAAALLFFVLQFARRLCRADGIGTRHFRWPERSMALLRRHIFWLMMIAIPLEFVSVLTEGQSFEFHREHLGRFFFAGSMAALSVFTLLVMRPFRGLPAPVLATRPDGWLSKLRYLWYPLVVALPLSLAVLSMTGYDYTALRLENRLFATILLTFGIVIVYSLVLRWLMVAQGKMALADAEEKRRALLAERSDEDGSDELPPASTDVSGLDLAKINEQSRQLLRTLVGISVVLGLWFVWADVLPALGVLKQVELWHHMADAGGEEGSKLVAVTLADLLLAIVFTFLTFAAARNLPGVLEMAVWKRLPIEQSSRYAINAVSQYVITGVGIVVAFNVIGIGWEQVQFLVAALGVGLGFGLQEIFANFISGLIILFERPIRVGDFVTVGGVDGAVTRIRIRATTITDLDRKELIVPNKTFITGELVNWTLSDPVTRVKVPIGIGYGSDTDLAERVMLDEARANSRVLTDPAPNTRMMGYGDSSVDYELRVYVNKWVNIVPVKDELYTAVFKAFKEHGIEIPFPQRDINVRTSGLQVLAPDGSNDPEEGGGRAGNGDTGGSRTP